MNKKAANHLAFTLLLLIFSMLLLSFASIPIYNLFCKATGFGGTTKRAEKFSEIKKGNRLIKVEFDANVDRNLPWKFVPKHRYVEVTTGEINLIFYEATNLGKVDIIGTAIYNVTPLKAGKYFVKIQCFCFEEQILKSGEKMLMPVSFYIDQALDEDRNMDDVDSITLSYSFFKVNNISN